MLKILIRATNWVGDAVMSLPAVRAIRAHFHDSEIAVLARPWVADLYARETSIDRVIPYEASPGFHDLHAKWAAAARLRAERFDIAVLLQNAFEAAAVARLARIPRIIGYKRDGRRWLLTDPIATPRHGEIPRHERFYYLELLRRAGILQELPKEEAIRLEGSHEAGKAGTRRFADLGIAAPVIGVSPGAAYGNAKRWLPERFAETAEQVARANGASVALFGSRAERALCESVRAQIAVPAHNLAGETTLREFIELAAACRLFLTNDSGAMHIASALGVPTVAVFGATDDVATGPTGSNSRIVREPVECSPCLLRECPIDHRCMTRVSASRVIEVSLDLIAR
ncbi:MAG: lipopolysaccharide heptosyltransferase II [Acidobacteriota bacterium]|nr:lipopolysaccharide heptosyltransferase II [Acidobacteriota bacterium]